MSKVVPKRRNAIKLITEDGFVRVFHHERELIKFDDEKIIINARSYHSPLTLRQINKYSKKFKLDIELFVDNSKWYLKFQGEVIPFKDEITLYRSK